MWVTVAKWVGIIVVLVFAIGYPAYWHSKKVADAFQNGYNMGYAAGVSAVTQQNLKKQQEFNAREQVEAQTRLEQNEILQKQITTTENKLRVALANKPSCAVDPVVAGILRSAAAGDFGDASGTTTSGPVAEVPNHA
jgi:hypothetical protein